MKCEIKHVPLSTSKTSVPQEWDKPRTLGVAPEPIMKSTVQKAKQAQRSRSVKCTLYEARTPDTIENDSAKIAQVQRKLKDKNPLYGFTYMASTETGDTEYVKTRLKSVTPVGSVLSYQLALTEGDFSVTCDALNMARFDCQEACNCNISTSLPVGSFQAPVYSSTTHRFPYNCAPSG